jgi:hypothetical protein
MAEGVDRIFICRYRRPVAGSGAALVSLPGAGAARGSGNLTSGSVRFARWIGPCVQLDDC